MNKQFLTGNVCGDPDMKATPAGVTVCSFVVASDRRFKDAHGEKVTDFFRVQAWRQLGDVCGKYVKKGMKVAVIGELQARTYEAKDGTTRMSLDVNADEVEFMSKAEEPKQQMTPADPNTFQDISSDDLPF
jgi:single-strand DNA-binding protein